MWGACRQQRFWPTQSYRMSTASNPKASSASVAAYVQHCWGKFWQIWATCARNPLLRRMYRSALLDWMSSAFSRISITGLIYNLYVSIFGTISRLPMPYEILTRTGHRDSCVIAKPLDVSNVVRCGTEAFVAYQQWPAELKLDSVTAGTVGPRHATMHA